MATVDSLSEEISSLDKKVDSVIEFLKDLKKEDGKDDYVASYLEEREKELDSEDRKFTNMKRKKRIYQAIPVTLDSLSTHGKRALKDLIPEPQVTKVPIEKAFKWLPLLLAGLTALGTVLFLFKDKILKFLDKLVPNFVKELVSKLVSDFLPKLSNILLGPAASAKALTGVGRAAQQASAAAVAEATEAKKIAFAKAFGVGPDGKITSARTGQINEFVEASLKSINPAERAKIQSYLKEWNIRTLSMSAEELQTTLNKMIVSGLKSNDLYAKSLSELIRLKKLGLTAAEIKELTIAIKPSAFKLVGEMGKSYFDEMIYQLRTVPKDVLKVPKDMIAEFLKSPFTEQEYRAFIKPIEEFFDNSLKAIGGKIEGAKLAISEKLAKSLKVFSLLDKFVLTPIFTAIGSIEVASTISKEIDKFGYNLNTILNAWVGSLTSVFTFGLVGLEDVKKQAQKEYEDFKNKNYANVVLREIFSIPDLFGKFVYGLSYQISTLFGLLDPGETAKQFEAARKSVDTTEFYNKMVNKVYNWVYGLIYKVVDIITFGKGVKKAEGNNLTNVSIPSIQTNDKSFFEDALKAQVQIVEKGNKEIVALLKDQKNNTGKMAEGFVTLSNTLMSKENYNVVNNSKNSTNLTIATTTSRSYRDSRFVT
jgi:predicted PurR-regulated permease PerM